MADFAALFPPLFAADDNMEDADVDISVDDIALPPLERTVESAVYAALHRWNEIEPVAAEAALPYMERIGKYQRLVSALLYLNEDDMASSALEDEQSEPQDEGAGSSSTETDRQQRKRRKSSQRRRRKQQQLLHDFQDIFGALPDIADLREERAPSARLQQFADLYRPKKPRLAQKRSAADTTTARSFEFARRQPPPAPDDVQTIEDQRVVNADDSDPIMWIDVLHASKDPAKTQSFLVRGSQTLSDVLDLVACAYDERLHEHNRNARLVFFGGQFYADTRVRHHDATAEPSSPAGVVDYSKEIRAWLQAKPSRLAKYGCSPSVGLEVDQPTRSLHETRFCDLQLLVDVPGVYIHQGECEHLLRLRDVRLPHEWDETETSSFPMRLPNTLYRSLRNCFICQHYSAKFVCYGDRLSVSDPMFFCNRCYRAAHYGRDGQLLYNDFQSFPFVQE